MADTARVFWSGRSQAVRLPKEYRFDTDTVSIRRVGSALYLEPLPTGFAEREQAGFETGGGESKQDDWAWLKDFNPDDDAIAAADEEPEPQRRPGLDEL
jgi:antitoxin VapB